MWPAGVSLVSEAWPDVSRPTLAGLIGCSANVGFLILGVIMLWRPVTPDTWRWVLLFGGTPVVLGVWVLKYVPESPRWLQQREQPALRSTSPLRDVFRPPLLRPTVLGILLGTIPLLGGWASGQRLVPWAGQVGEAMQLPSLKAATQTVWAVGAVLGSLAGGWIASRVGRRLSYFLISGLSLAISVYIFAWLTPDQPQFLWAVFLLGLISTSFFGWLPFFLPELFPTQVRATGSGVSYNFGRIVSAAVLLSSTQLSAAFGGNIAKMGAATSLVYLLGMIIIWMVPAHAASGDRAA
jgi:MFS family permease